VAPWEKGVWVEELKWGKNFFSSSVWKRKTDHVPLHSQNEKGLHDGSLGRVKKRDRGALEASGLTVVRNRGYLQG
jgi:hypothetical protein